MIDVTIPVRTYSASNGGQGFHWRVIAGRRKNQRDAVSKAMLGRVLPPLPVAVRLERISAGMLDEDDNLRVALKTIKDQIADFYNLPDNDKRFTWSYAQSKGPQKHYAVRITIEPRGA